MHILDFYIFFPILELYIRVRLYDSRRVKKRIIKGQIGWGLPFDVFYIIFNAR